MTPTMCRISLLVAGLVALACVASTHAASPGTAAMLTSTQVEITDFDFTDANHGWVLGGVVPCASACPDLFLWTYDHGQWTSRPLPRDMDWFSMELGARVDQVQFANPHDGWLYGLNLYATHDGGKNWSQVRLPASFPARTGFGPVVVSGTRIWAFLTTCSGGYVNPRCSLYRIGTAAVWGGNWHWRRVSAAPVPRLIRSLALADGRHQWRPPTSVAAHVVTAPCGGRIWPAYLNGTSQTNLWAVCVDSPSRTLAQRKAVYRSSVGGRSWHKVWDTRGHSDRLRFTHGQVNGLAVTSSSTAWIAVLHGPLMVSHDGGKSWQTALSRTNHAQLGPIQFTDARHGWVQLYPGTMLHTTDGGRTWQRAALERPSS
jgi:photosystem II stability/assembly factor-like uncharacterized protein